MIPAVLIAKKRDGHRLQDDEIAWFIEGFTDGKVADYQMSALAMATCLRGMDADETAALTKAMLRSGDALERAGDEQPRVDKHSTGGLGDKVSLILAPLLACCDVLIPMISGRGLGITGGTLDKLEAIPGFRSEWSNSEASKLLRQVGCHIISANKQLAPADRRLYSLRDVTGTVESVSLITASILSKKLAASLDALVMDVKVGNGAFMKTFDQATELAESLVQTGSRMNLPVSALLTDMDQPLGCAIGNAVEVNEVIDLLQGDGPDDVRDLTLQLSAQLLVAVGRCSSLREATELLNQKWDDGSAMQRFEEMIAAQGGRIDGHLPVAASHPIVSQDDGFVSSIDCAALGQTIIALGGGRRKVEDVIDPRVGLSVQVTIGDNVDRGQVLGHVFSDTKDSLMIADRLALAFHLADEPISPRSLVLQTMESPK